MSKRIIRVDTFETSNELYKFQETQPIEPISVTPVAMRLSNGHTDSWYEVHYVLTYYI